MHKYDKTYNVRMYQDKLRIAQLIEKATQYKVTDIEEKPLHKHVGVNGDTLSRGAFGYVTVGTAEVIGDDYEPYLMSLNEKQKYFWKSNVKGVKIVGYNYKGYKAIKIKEPGRFTVEVIVADSNNNLLSSTIENDTNLVTYLLRYVEGRK